MDSIASTELGGILRQQRHIAFVLNIGLASDLNADVRLQSREWCLRQHKVREFLTSRTEVNVSR